MTKHHQYTSISTRDWKALFSLSRGASNLRHSQNGTTTFPWVCNHLCLCVGVQVRGLGVVTRGWCWGLVALDRVPHWHEHYWRLSRFCLPSLCSARTTDRQCCEWLLGYGDSVSGSLYCVGKCALHWATFPDPVSHILITDNWEILYQETFSFFLSFLNTCPY